MAPEEHTTVKKIPFKSCNKIIILGWGTLQPSGSQPDILQEISLPVIDTSLCTTIMALQDVTVSKTKIVLSYQICKVHNVKPIISKTCTKVCLIIASLFLLK